jgi:hypothetical protein
MVVCSLLIKNIDKKYEEFPTIDMPPRAQNQKNNNKQERKETRNNRYACFSPFLHVIREVD